MPTPFVRHEMTQTAIIQLYRHRLPRDKDTPVVVLWVDGKQCQGARGDTVLQVAAAAGVYLPALCQHPGLPSTCAAPVDKAESGCGLCLVEVEGVAGLHRACAWPVAAGLRVFTQSPALQRARQEALARILEHHPHVCLTCPQRDGCSRVMCCFNNRVEERCCSIMSHCELRKVADYVVIPATTPAYDPAHNRLPVLRDGPFYDLDYNLCIDCRRCLVACNEVRGVGCLEVKNTNGRSWVGPIADTLVESGCKFCNACIEVCPTGALLDRTMDSAQRQSGQAPCTRACPAGIDVPRYVQLAGLGRFAQANAVVREKLPFPGILGRACYAPCESDCRRGNLDDPLSIRSLKRVAADHDDGRWRELQRREPATGHRVAVIGAGPAGLTAGFYLAKKGHAVTIFEAMPSAGGMARYGIPAYRLPRDIIDDEIAEVAALGVEFHFNRRVESPGELLASGFDAVFIAIGAQAALKPGVPGEELPGVIGGIDFLRDVATGKTSSLPDSVSVIGGGDVACDAARTALRMSRGGVELVYRRAQGAMSAQAGEIEALLAEGGEARFQQMPQSIREDDARGLEVTWYQTRLGRTDALGRRHLEGVPGSEASTSVGLLIVATGQVVQRMAGVAADEQGRVVVDDTGKLPGSAPLFAGGDAVTGPSSLIDAVARGRLAAMSIDRHLGGDGDIDETLLDADAQAWQTSPWLGREEGFNQRRATEPPSQHLKPCPGWDEIETCYPAQDAIAEGLRCLKCNAIHEIGEAVLPPVSWRRLDLLNAHATAAEAGVYTLFDVDKQVLAIKGAANVQAALLDVLAQEGEKRLMFFEVEMAHYYSQRESELLQVFSEQHGRLPPGVGEDAIDDLF